MYSTFQRPGSRYHVGLIEDRIAGGGGIYPSDGLPEGVCELVEMYLTPIARGKELGRQLIERSLSFARDYGQHRPPQLPEVDAKENLGRIKNGR